MDNYLHNWYTQKYQETGDVAYKKAADDLAAKATPKQKPEGVARFLAPQENQ